ncbi:MAG: 50S ribosomal protein P1 [Nanoarchaeota archaeon]|nr:50S ribosomal protein P1 [Nanoarchaeota archaeon]MCG2718559.1 50S ribosomal protein P1 [Nanoarchaeota archaeon]
MELIYAAMLLHKAGKEINEANLKKVVEAAGIKKDATQIKALVSALDGVDIEKAIKEAIVPVAAAPAAAVAGEEKKEEKKEEKSAEDKKGEEEAATAGLGALFG